MNYSLAVSIFVLSVISFSVILYNHQFIEIYGAGNDKSIDEEGYKDHSNYYDYFDQPEEHASPYMDYYYPEDSAGPYIDYDYPESSISDDDYYNYPNREYYPNYDENDIEDYYESTNKGHTSRFPDTKESQGTSSGPGSSTSSGPRSSTSKTVGQSVSAS